jgi:hypothetical protein
LGGGGGGTGGTATTGTNAVGGNGGSGIVIISHASTYKQAQVTGACKITFTSTNTVYSFVGQGTITF